MLLKGLLFFSLLYVVNQAHIRFETGIPAVAPINIVLVLILIQFPKQPDELADVRPRMLRPMCIFLGR